MRAQGSSLLSSTPYTIISFSQILPENAAWHWQARVRARSAYSYLQRGDRPNNSFRKVSVRKTRLHTHTSGGGASGGATLAIPCLDDTATGEPHGINKSKSARPTECARLGERNKQKRETAKTTTMKQNSPPPPPSH